MNWYDRHILPRLIDCACGVGPIEKQRLKIIPRAHGQVIEIGIGSGRNLPFYDARKVERVIGVDPDEAMWKRAADKVAACEFPVERIGLSAEAIPLEDACADTVVVTYSLCTIPDPARALRDMARLLKPGGAVIFTEHGKAPDAHVCKWQSRIDPVWKRIAGGCHSGRDIPALFKTAGYQLAELDEMYIPGPKVLSYHYWGSAVPEPL